jgi:hypothetical protein
MTCSVVLNARELITLSEVLADERLGTQSLRGPR